MERSLIGDARVREGCSIDIFADADDRFVVEETNNIFFKQYKRMQSLLWVQEDVTMTNAMQAFKRLTHDQQHGLKLVLGLFATADGIVNENMVVNFTSAVKHPSLRACYMLQMYIEVVHGEMYSALLRAYITDRNELYNLMRASKNIPCIKLKADWALQWTSDTNVSFTERTIAFAAVEGIFFSSSFAYIFALKAAIKGPDPVTGINVIPEELFTSNDFIARDEGMHMETAALVYSTLEPLSTSRVHTIISGAVDCEKSFVREVVPTATAGISANSMCIYVEYVADRLLEMLGHPKLYNSRNPFKFMEQQSMDTMTNMFEGSISEYNSKGTFSREITFDEDC